MKFYIRQQPFSWRERFTVRDEKERDVLVAMGEFISLGAKLHLQDMSGRKIGSIHQQMLGWRPRYLVEINGRQAGFVVRRFALIGSRFDFDGLGWVAEGTFGSHDFTVYDQERIVMSVRKARLSWGDSYELDIKVRDEILPAVFMLLAINLALAVDNG
jgi:uncharacterized protein YxjI